MGEERKNIQNYIGALVIYESTRFKNKFRVQQTACISLIDSICMIVVRPPAPPMAQTMGSSTLSFSLPPLLQEGGSFFTCVLLSLVDSLILHCCISHVFPCSFKVQRKTLAIQGCTIKVSSRGNKTYAENVKPSTS